MISCARYPQLTFCLDRWWSWGFNDIAQTSILDTISRLKSERPELRLSIGAPESLKHGPDGKTSLKNRASPLSSYPFRHLSSCTIDQFCPVHAVNAPDLKEMLLGSPELEDLSLTWGIRKATRVRWHIRDGERLPPVTKLILRGMHWNMSRSNAITFWDWSRISHLELYIVDISRFLRTVTAEHLPKLRTFVTDGWCRNMFVPADELTKHLCNFVRDTQALEKLAMRCRVEVDKVLLYLGAVSKHASTLRSLEIRTLAHERHSEFGVRHLTALNTACPELRELGFDLVMNVKSKPPATLTTTIAGFRKMRSLTVYAYMWVENREQGFDEDRATASAWIEDLVSSKQGVQLEKVIVKLEARRHDECTYYSTISYTHDFGGVGEWHCDEQFKEWRRRDSKHVSWTRATQLTETAPFWPNGYPFGYS